MAEKKKKPEIRFKGFVDDWVESELNTWADRYDSLRVPITATDRISGNTPYYGANGIQDYVEGFTHDGQFILVAEDGANDLKNYPVQYVKGKIWVNNHAHVLQAKKNIADNQFLKYAISQTNIEPFLVGGGRAKLNADAMMKIGISAPVNAYEQKRLGIYFAQIDTLLTLHQQKYDKLANLKKAMLEKMFPKNGADAPEIRFKGFSGVWEERKLGDLSMIGDIDHRMPESVTDGIPYLMTGDFVGINELNFENSKLISIKDYKQLSKKIKPEAGDILFARYASVGAVRYVETQIKFLISYSCAILKQNAAVNGEYLFYYLQASEIQRQIEIEINTGSQRNIGIDSLKKFIILLPQEKEQEKIASFFKQINNDLILHQREIEKLNNIKKSMLEKMFV